MAFNSFGREEVRKIGGREEWSEGVAREGRAWRRRRRLRVEPM